MSPYTSKIDCKFTGHVEHLSADQAERLARAPNVEAIRTRKGGRIKRLIVHAHSSAEHETGGGHDSSIALTYQEEAGGHHLTILKRYTRDGQFVRWSDRDGFNPRRFNPDRLPTNEREMTRQNG